MGFSTGEGLWLGGAREAPCHGKEGRGPRQEQIQAGVHLVEETWALVVLLVSPRSVGRGHVPRARVEGRVWEHGGGEGAGCLGVGGGPAREPHACAPLLTDSLRSENRNLQGDVSAQFWGCCPVAWVWAWRRWTAGRARLGRRVFTRDGWQGQTSQAG